MTIRPFSQPHLIRDINLSGDSSPQELTTVGSYIFFNADDGDEEALWKSDGTAAGTKNVKNVKALNIIPAGSNLFFTSEANGSSLWFSDGTNEGTRYILTLVDITESIFTGERLFFIGKDSLQGYDCGLVTVHRKGQVW